MECNSLPGMVPRPLPGRRSRQRRARLPLLAGGAAAALAALWCLSAHVPRSFAPHLQQQLPLRLARPQASLTATSSSTAAWHHRGQHGRAARATRLAATNPSFQGQVKVYAPDKGFGFIECSETFGMFQRDVFLHKQQADRAGVSAGDRVTFRVETNDRGQPQARDVQVFVEELAPKDPWAAVEAGNEAAEDAWAAAEDEKKAAEDAWAAAEANKKGAEDAWAAAEDQVDAAPAASATEEIVAEEAAPEEEEEDEEEEEEEEEEAEEEEKDPVDAAPAASAAEEVAPKQKEERQEEKKPEQDDHQDGGDLARRLDVDPLFIAGVEEVRKQKSQLEKDLMGSADMEQRELTTKQKELARCSKITDSFDALLSTAEALEEAKEMASSGSELAELAMEEAEELKETMASLKEDLQACMLPVDPRDEASIAILEIRPGTGGSEASLWAEDLLNMYKRFCEAEGMRCKMIGQNSREGGGVMDAQMEISGEEVYSKLKFEAGVHRVQRVPVTEKANRIHTSTATVALMPELEGIDDDFSLNDCEITFCRAGGPGGQNVNKVATACRIKHIPSGVQLICREERSQAENKMRAIRYIKTRLLSAKLEARDKEYAAIRKDQLGTGDRSEKVRSYNYKEDRVSDHRLGRNFPLHSFMQGNLGEPVRLLRVMEQQQKLAAFKADMTKKR